MAIIKKPIKKTLFYLSSALGLILSLVAGFFLKNSQYNLSELENKAKNLFNTDLINKVNADVPFSGGCAGGCIGGCASANNNLSSGDGCGSASASCGCAGCSDSSASSSGDSGDSGDSGSGSGSGGDGDC